MKWSVILLLLVSCIWAQPQQEIDPSIPAAPYLDFIPAHAKKIQMPAEYRQLWKDISDCAKLHTGRLNRITFFSVGDSTDQNFPCPVATSCWGWHRPHQIYLTYHKVHDKGVVRHEMLHEIIYMAGIYQTAEPHHQLFIECKALVS